MNNNKRTSLVFLFIGLMLSFLVSAQSSFYIKGLSVVENITSGSIWVTSVNGTVSQDIYNLNITNGSDIVKITGDTTNSMTGTVIATQLNVRSGPGTSYSVLGGLSNGKTVSIIESTSGFYKINFNGSVGYVSSAYIQLAAGVVIPNATPQPTTPTGKIKSITVDAGHGGYDCGAVGPSGTLEKDITLKVALKVKNLLTAKGYKVTMTRTDDTFVSLQQRCVIANNAKSDIFVSIHNNSAESSLAHGTETFSYADTGEGAKLSKSVQKQLINTLGLTDRGTKSANYYVLTYTNMPSILTELAFINNKTEESLLKTDSFQTKSAQAIVDGIEAYNK